MYLEGIFPIFILLHNLGLSQEEEDIWASDHSDVEYERQIAEREWSRLNETFGNEGYKEGLSEGKDQTIESCFGDGFTEGGKYGVRMGELRGWLSTLLVVAESLNLENTKLVEIKTLEEELRQYKSDKMFSTQYFRKESSIPKLEKPKSQGCCKEENDSACCQKDDNSGCSGTQIELNNKDRLETLPTDTPYTNTFQDRLPAEIVREYEDKVTELVNSLNLNISL
ncbi:hypothetical protein K7432_012613 [Basidiobolus ranarum]|uniref:Protein YAE1 n=1 Tax=Basidiobolus ranarum TaxID=34480 RepID=A0ABR2VSV9_9FUNG